jgi:hypothetical protein
MGILGKYINLIFIIMANREILNRLLTPVHTGNPDVDLVNVEKWKEFLDNVNENISWYPSAGFDFYDIYILNNELNRTNITPSVYIHSDFRYNAEIFNNNGVRMDDGLEFDFVYYFELKSEIIDFGQPHENIYRSCDRNYGRIFLINVNVKYNNCKLVNKYVIYFFVENNCFFETFIINQELKLSHIFSQISKMEGDNPLSEFWRLLTLHPNVKYLISDNRLFINQDDFERLDKIEINNNLSLQGVDIINGAQYRRGELKIYKILRP